MQNVHCHFLWLMLLPASFASALATDNNTTTHARQIITVLEPPSSYLDSHGRLTGYATDIVRALQKIAGDTTDIQLMPESRALLTAARQANVLLYGFSRTPDRENDYHWIMPLARKKWMLYMRSDDPQQLNSLNDARALETIGVVRGDVREEWLRAQGFTNLQSSSSHVQNLARLTSRRLNAIAFEPQGMQYLTRETGVRPDDYRAALHFFDAEVWLLMSRQSTASEVARWQQAALQLQQSGRLEQIARSWQQRLLHNENIQSSIAGQLLCF
jgi:polar amino acid transport system substrate-binding protein